VRTVIWAMYYATPLLLLLVLCGWQRLLPGAVVCHTVLSVALLYTDSCVFPLKQPCHRLYANIVTTAGLALSSPLDRGSFSSKWAMLVLACTYFPGAYSKLLHTPWDWLDGSVLKSHIMNSAHGTFATDRRNSILSVSPHIGDYLPFSFMAISSLLFEGLFPIALFKPGVPLPFWCLCACEFHVMIWGIMGPEFSPQCLVVFIALGLSVPFAEAIPARWLGRQCQGLLPILAPPLPLKRPVLQRGDEARAGIAMLLAALVLVATFARIEAWPLSTISMYSVSRNQVTEANGGVVFASRASMAKMVHLFAVREVQVYNMFFSIKRVETFPNNPIKLVADLVDIPPDPEAQPVYVIEDYPWWKFPGPECTEEPPSRVWVPEPPRPYYIEAAQNRVHAETIKASMLQLAWLNSSRPVTEHSWDDTALASSQWPDGGPALSLLQRGPGRWLANQLCRFCRHEDTGGIKREVMQVQGHYPR